ncbi:hypothetical protein [Rhodococcus sp. 14-2470-1a]|uniref:hypothetical protein n=1 Tax=Rhodococcus sp. 14-2470-1a TaxID=2023150 RepID=UPI000B9B7373|nr:MULTISPECIES: hypothetical protein [unclassified Rhodococcus (in: high G+C Gram-positive bacteria)]OZD62872.1 hypothetical protein CH263_19160 [Rhodococcus sp. 06-1059B-a]OZE82411.1 hypothetical protein CH304_11720 [Rhodococcus sp. 15-649-1-2]OZF05685.1 hypothetical protein CH300_10520 [Rhodococcus sp. 15-1154-1]OZF48806.1 hypothetical protein CH292_15790 [Rhodococcus sp. 14-2470-1a]
MKKLAIRTATVAALIGGLGAAGAAVATADTVTELVPAMNGGAYCLVVQDVGAEQLLYSGFRCDEVQADIDEKARQDERREERKEERREELLRNG